MGKLLIGTFVIVFFFISSVAAQGHISVVELPVKEVPHPRIPDTAVQNWNRAQPGFSRLSKEAQEMLYYTNLARSRPRYFWDSVMTPLLGTFLPLNTPEAKSLRTELSTAPALPMFRLNTVLTGTAQAHSDDIARKKSPISHTSTDGTAFGARMKRAGIRFCASENISLSSQGVIIAVALLYLDINVPDLGHRKALMNPSLLEIGIGAAQYGKDQVFLVQDFSCAQQ
jgi:uncharacterized protein YkwD